jgi:hypothetical protein
MLPFILVPDGSGGQWQPPQAITNDTPAGPHARDMKTSPGMAGRGLSSVVARGSGYASLLRMMTNVSPISAAASRT